MTIEPAAACPTCGQATPSVARFCGTCGRDLHVAGSGGRHFAVCPGEPVASFNIVSSLMPLAGSATPQSYRFALLAAVGVTAMAAVLGAVPFALMAAAGVVPIVFLRYLYDVNEWEDQPVVVVGATTLLSAALAIGFGLWWTSAGADPGRLLASAGSVRLRDALIVCVLVPVVGEVLKQIGPVFLASRPRFDDLLDGLTFGIASGVAFAAAETIVVNRDLVLGGARATGEHGSVWLAVALTAAVVKPLVYGTATGIAAAAFSGLGEGHDGLTPAYLRSVAFAIVANVVFQAGLFASGTLGGATGVTVGLLWGLLVAGGLLLRIRSVMHHGLLEGALEAAARGSTRWTSAGLTHCPSCEFPVPDESRFCLTCGTAVRAATKPARRALADPDSAATPHVDPRRRNVVTAVGVALAVGALGTIGLAAGPMLGEPTAASDSRTVRAAAQAVVPTPVLDDGPALAPAAAALPGPGTDPPVAPETPTTVRRVDGSVSLGRPVRAGHGISVRPAVGYRTVRRDDTVVLVGDDSVVRVTVVDRSDLGDEVVDPESVLAWWSDHVLAGDVVDRVESSVAIDLPSATVTGAAQRAFTGVSPSNQGSTPVAGVATVYVRLDGVAVVVDVVAPDDVLGGGAAAHRAMLGSVVESL